MKENKYIFGEYKGTIFIYKRVGKNTIVHVGTTKNALSSIIVPNHSPTWDVDERDVLKTPEEYYGY